MHSRRALFSICIMVQALLGIQAAMAQQYPVRPVRVISGFPPGGPVDDQGRVIGQKFAQVLGQQLVMDSRPGADGILATDLTAKAPADGYTLMLIASGFTTTPALHARLPYDPVRDFAPVIQTTNGLLALVINPSVPAKSLSELIALARSQPGRLNYGSAGLGSSTHLSVEYLAGLAGVRMTHIPYKGAAPAMTDLLGGQIQLLIGPLATSIQHVRAGKVRLLGVTSPQRSPLFPDVQAIDETLPGFQVGSWYGLIAPGRTPASIVEFLNAEVGKILLARDVGDALTARGMDPAGGSSQAFGAFIASEIVKWQKVVKDAGIVVQ